MRPLRLELKGFTAFRDEQAIDFEGLDLFAISGPTGSGKTSILDAITYALFGYIERVGKQAGQFVSQGQARMAVCLEFAVDGDRYRVTRSTPTKGASRILLERWDAGGWRQAGEGADHVREADALIRSAVGLDYDAFTRSVLLPQGRFAEFLVGDARERRAILTDLLGLELFERLARLAGEAKRDAQVQAETRTHLLETEYEGVTPDAVRDAFAAAADATGTDERLAAAESEVRAIAERWADSARVVRDLQGCARDAREAAGVADGSADALRDLIDRQASAETLVKERVRALATAEKAAEAAAKALAKAEARWGGPADLARAQAKAERLAQAQGEAEAVAEEVTRAEGARPGLAEAVTAADGVAAARVAEAEAALGALAAAEVAVEEARHADLVAAVRAGVRSGEACPVCGQTVASLPAPRGARPLKKAQSVLEEAKTSAAKAHEALRAAERASDAAAADLREADRELARLRKAAKGAASDVRALGTELADAMGGARPADPLAVLSERLERIEALDEAARAGATGVTDAREAAGDAERALDAVAAGIAEARARLDGVPVTGLLERARSVAGGEIAVPALPSALAATRGPALHATAVAIGGGLRRLAEDLEVLAERRAEGEGAVVREARGVLDGLLDLRVGTVTELVEGVARARLGVTRAAQTAHDGAELLRSKLERAQVLVRETAVHRVRAERFDALAKELRADRIIAFLQLEALELLAAAGSERLSTLSSGRFRLEYAQDEFFVVDTWNGEERRSARTLSGGETFLASLALALALSEEVGSLSVTEKARLDSLFLDEGFGTLDPETLEVVVDAIEQLGGDGRMVGVITHVQELAVRLPARIEVEKSPRGSQLRIVV